MRQKKSRKQNQTWNKNPRKHTDLDKRMNRRENTGEDTMPEDPGISIRSVFNPYWSWKFAH
ncbi:MAG: hypothetical protein A2901_06725 [Elusimicrobia bacterium RIFCSPLOWO2_01_FULL_54_10]|nr:MAG: hypothetical protein A2901_06725 [Elusimicrobia bacterium RIFCSPLOWO2_01_FULL_54_10]